MKAVIKRNTDKEYPCVNCGSVDANIIREGDDPKLKCNRCNMLYEASVSLEAKEAGAIPDGAPQIDEQQATDRRVKVEPGQLLPSPPTIEEISSPTGRIPRTINYVFVSKDRKRCEFIATKDLKKVALKWESEGKNYELFELQPKRSSVKIDIE